MSSLFVSARGKLDSLLLGEEGWSRELSLSPCGRYQNKKYVHANSMQYITIFCNDNTDFVVHAKMDLYVVRHIDSHDLAKHMNIHVLAKRMQVYDSTSIRDIELEAVDFSTTHIRIETMPQTNNFTVDFMLDCLVANMKRFV